MFMSQQHDNSDGEVGHVYVQAAWQFRRGGGTCLCPSSMAIQTGRWDMFMSQQYGNSDGRWDMFMSQQHGNSDGELDMFMSQQYGNSEWRWTF